MSPQLGQGVNLALADASCLSDCIARHPLSQALVRYQRRRWLALRYYQLATRWLTPWFQSDCEWLTPVRRVFFGISRRIRWAQLLMTLSMAGLVGSAASVTAGLRFFPLPNPPRVRKFFRSGQGFPCQVRPGSSYIRPPRQSGMGKCPSG